MQTNKDGGQKLFSQFGLFSISLFLLTTSLYAGSFEDFKRTQNSEFTKYSDARDKEFNGYLKTAWQEYTAKFSPPIYAKPKPKNITPTTQKKIIPVGPKVIIRVKKEIKQEIAVPKIVEKDFLKESKKDIEFLFYGQSVGFDIDKKVKNAKFYPQSQTGIANFFDRVASHDYEVTLRDIKDISKKLNLNDWAIYLLIDALSQKAYTNRDEAKLFTWFMLNKLGYEVKIGLGAKHVVLMHYSEKIIYDTPRYKFGDKLFYVISNYAKGISEKVYTYKQSYPKAEKALDMSLKVLPKFDEDLKSKTLLFTQYGKEYSVSFNYDKNLIDFMASYPQADYETYFNAPMQEQTYKSIAKDLKRYIDGKHSSVAINFVLNFVQKAFVYEVDQEQFGREKVMFAEETLYYKKSDCEDRAILFSYLVKELFGISVIGVKYSDHMTTALYIPMKGDSVQANRRRFVIADPTYINANVGQSMPRYQSKIPQSFIVVK